MTTGPRLAVLGSVNMDLVLRCPHLPRPGETLLGSDFRTLPGGKGANQAVAAARLGASVSFIGCVGNDAFGVAARAALAQEGVATDRLHTVDSAPTGVAMIFVDAAGENCIGLAAGANAALTTAHVDAAAPLIEAAAMLVCQLESPLAVVEHAVVLAHRAGVRVLLTPAPATPLALDLAPYVSWLVPNQGEAAVLAGLAADADPRDAARRLVAFGFRCVVMTLGQRGVCIADAAGVREFPARPVQPVDTTGAGDTFAAALGVALGEGLTLDTAVDFAQRAAAISVTREGAMASMPRRHEVSPSAPLGPSAPSKPSAPLAPSAPSEPSDPPATSNPLATSNPPPTSDLPAPSAPLAPPAPPTP